MPAMTTPAASAPADDDLVAAALAAVGLYLEAESPAEDGAARPAWRVAAIVAAQGLAPARGMRRVSWASAERAGRAARWSGGMHGTFD